MESRKLARKIAVAAGAAFVAYGAIGVFVVPLVAKPMIAARLSEQLGRPVEIARLSLNPYTLETALEGFRILEADRRTVFASFERLDAVASFRSLANFAPVVNEMTVNGLKVRLVRDAENHYNVSDVLAVLAARASAKAKAKPGDEPRFSLANIRLVGGSIEFDDRPKGATHRVTDIDIAIPLLSNLPTHLKEYVQPRLFANVNGAPLHIRGETLPFENSLRTHVVLQFDRFDIRRYAGYSPEPLPVQIDSGTLDGRIAVRFTHADGKDPAIDLSGSLALHDAAVSNAEGRLGRAGRAEIEIASLDPLAGLAHITALRIADLEVGAEPWRVGEAQANGVQVDLHAKSVKVDSIATKAGLIAAKRGADGSFEMPVKVALDAQPAAAPASPWQVSVARATLDDYRITLQDASVKPAAMQRIVIAHAEASDLSTAKGSKAGVDARLVVNGRGTVEVRSTLGFDPLSVDANLDARQIDLVPLRPYVTQFQTVGLKSARASAKGRLEARGEGASVRIAYHGSAEVSKLATVDTVNREDLLNWDSVGAERIALQWAADEPLDLAVADIAVKSAYSRVVVMPDGTINLQQLKAATPEEPAPAPQSPETVRPRNVRIDRITFSDSRLNFTDHFIKPNYTADVGDLHGTVAGLSSDPATRATVDLEGSYDKSSPVVIAGTINPLSGNLFLDIAAKGKDIELPRLSAYSIRYAGYGITGGRLTLDVKYHVEDGKLEGRNNILLDQLTFGDKVESPEATKLPVLFAVNLLKDAQGRINLELPISGSLEDPQFEMSALIGQVVSNLLKKALTSPFSLLTASLGGSSGSAGAAGASSADDLAFVAFDPGRDEAGDAERGKLERISKALLDRPAVRIEMAPHVDSQKDLEALRRAALHASLEKAKPANADADYAKLVAAAYQRDFPAPRRAADAKEPPKAPTTEEMEAKLMERLAVGEPELRALAERRAQWVRTWLVSNGKLPADRVLLSSAAAGDAPERESRVDFTLK